MRKRSIKYGDRFVRGCKRYIFNTVDFMLNTSLRPFSIIDWFTDPPTLLFGKSEKIKLKICFYSLLMIILIMDRNIKNNKKRCIDTSIHE